MSEMQDQSSGGSSLSGYEPEVFVKSTGGVSVLDAETDRGVPAHPGLFEHLHDQCSAQTVAPVFRRNPDTHFRGALIDESVARLVRIEKRLIRIQGVVGV